MVVFLSVMLLAVIQGVTEFLPVSSSGHLVLAKHVLGVETPGAILEVCLHAGTLVSVLLYYRSRIIGLCRDVFLGQKRAILYAGAVLLGSLPVGLVYVLLRDQIESLFAAPIVAAGMLCLTGCILLTLRLRPSASKELKLVHGVWIGIAQAFAIVPGISRAGSTITLGRHLGLSPELAAEFSLLLSVPALAGATVIKAFQLGSGPIGDVPLPVVGAGMLVAACVGYAAIAVLVRTLSTGKFWMFGIYCLVAGLGGLLFLAT